MQSERDENDLAGRLDDVLRELRRLSDHIATAFQLPTVLSYRGKPLCDMSPEELEQCFDVRFNARPGGYL
jgi:hypothetical protein